MRQERETAPPQPSAAARLGIASTIVSFHVGLWLIAAPVAVGLVCVDTAMIGVVLFTALYASPHFSERAFRLLACLAQRRPLPVQEDA